MTPPPVHIIGGGLAGGMAALTLAREGKPAIVYEKTQTPGPKVCGEFLSFEAVERLNAVAPEILGSASAPPITQALFTTADRQTRFSLPKTCAGIGRETLDRALLDAAAVRGATLKFGTSIRSLSDLPSDQPKVLATGKLNLSGAGRTLRGNEATMIGLKQHFKCSAHFPDKLRSLIQLFFFEGGYGGLVEINDNRVSLAIAVEKSRFAQAGNDTTMLVAQCAAQDPSLAHWLDHVTLIEGSALAIGQVPYGYLRRLAVANDVYAVGDQAAVIPSFSGDGQAIALASGDWAAQAILQGKSAQDFQPKAAQKLSRNIRTAHLMTPLIKRLSILNVGLPLLNVPGVSAMMFAMTRTAD